MLAFLVAATMEGFTQIRVANSTGQKIMVGSENGLTTTPVNDNTTIFIYFLSPDASGNVKLNLWYFNAKLQKIKVGLVSRQVKKGKIVIKDFSLEEEKAVEKVKEVEKITDVNNSDTIAENQRAQDSIARSLAVEASLDGWWSETKIVPKNESSFRFVILDKPFAGLALKSGQASAKSVVLKTGLCSFSGYYDEDTDSSTGRRYQIVIVNQIIVEGQDTLRITNNDLQKITSGFLVKKPVKNNFKIDFLIMDGPNIAKVIPGRGMIQLDLNPGWNVFTVQYTGKDGRPIQTTFSLLTDSSAKPLIIDKNTGNFDSIEPGQFSIRNK
jgi:hypothetical protein